MYVMLETIVGAHLFQQRCNHATALAIRSVCCAAFGITGKQIGKAGKQVLLKIGPSQDGVFVSRKTPISEDPHRCLWEQRGGGLRRVVVGMCSTFRVGGGIRSGKF